MEKKIEREIVKGGKENKGKERLKGEWGIVILEMRPVMLIIIVNRRARMWN